MQRQIVRQLGQRDMLLLGNLLDRFSDLTLPTWLARFVFVGSASAASELPPPPERLFIGQR